MATNAQWTVVFDDKVIINQTVKNNDGYPTSYLLTDSSFDSFWNDSKWSNVWAIQYKDDDHDYNDTVEFRDETPHKTWVQAGLGDFRSQFVSKWDTAHLNVIQLSWDNNNVIGETESEKISRLGEKPTSYSSY
tara:strand:+ start:269 stop:667 length:399 start_codon:yes stop_codon:yes gene_type:complete